MPIYTENSARELLNSAYGFDTLEERLDDGLTRWLSEVLLDHLDVKSLYIGKISKSLVKQLINTFRETDLREYVIDQE